ncbi:MAG TPA: hypothetical protein VGI34_10515 [Candidatus Acidoferrales bacterium]|jgi:hypothetical protein
MKNITLSADDELIEQARQLARAQKRTLNDAFREWLVQFTQQAGNVEEFDALMERLSRTVRLHPPYSRDEMNER